MFSWPWLMAASASWLMGYGLLLLLWDFGIPHRIANRLMYILKSLKAIGFWVLKLSTKVVLLCCNRGPSGTAGSLLGQRGHGGERARGLPAATTL